MEPTWRRGGHIHVSTGSQKRGGRGRAHPTRGHGQRPRTEAGKLWARGALLLWEPRQDSGGRREELCWGAERLGDSHPKVLRRGASACANRPHLTGSWGWGCSLLSCPLSSPSREGATALLLKCLESCRIVGLARARCLHRHSSAAQGRPPKLYTLPRRSPVPGRQRQGAEGPTWGSGPP